jgi:hypothetical protein
MVQHTHLLSPGERRRKVRERDENDENLEEEGGKRKNPLFHHIYIYL